jgi:hypothetical protein
MLRPRSPVAAAAPAFPAAALLFAAATLPILVAACGRTGEDYSREVVRAVDQGRLVGTRGTMETIGRALAAHAVDRGGYPAGGTARDLLAALSPAFLPAAQAIDAWGNELHYSSDTRTYTLTSAGADGRVGTDDDVVMVEGRFTRLPSAAAR